jgi:hypothetical protein
MARDPTGHEGEKTETLDMLRRNGMRKAVVVLLAVFLIGALTADAAVTLKKTVGDKDLKVKMFGFQQLDMRGGDGYDPGGDDDGVFFKAQRVRVGWKFYYGKTMGKLFLDFNKSFENKGANLPEGIKDAFVGYRWSNAAMIRLGMIKTPVGMGFTIPGWNLDNVERSRLDKQLVLERSFGLMMSGRIIGDPDMKTDGTEMGHERQGKGFGYDVGVFNLPGRSGAVRDKSGKLGLGDSLTYTFRLHYDHTEAFHFEISYGTVEAPSSIEMGEDYDVFDLGVNSFLGDWNLKFEYINGTNIRFEEDREQNAMVFTVGRMLSKQTEVVLKHYQGSFEDSFGTDTDLANTYVGAHFYLEPLAYSHRKLQSHRISVFYVLTGGDDSVGGDWDMANTLGGYIDDVWMTQWQWKW